MKKSALLFAFLLMFFIQVNYANAEDFMNAMKAFARDICNSTQKSLDINYFEKVAGSSYNIEFTVDKNGNFGNFKVISSTNNKEADEYIINTIKAQAHKYPLPSQMAYIQRPVRMNVKGYFKKMKESDWKDYTNKVQTEVFGNTDTIILWAEKSKVKLKRGTYAVYVDKDGIFYNVKVIQSAGDSDFDDKMVNLIKSKSGVVPMPENCKMNIQNFTLTIDFE